MNAEQIAPDTLYNGSAGTTALPRALPLDVPAPQTRPFATGAARWAALRARDPAADGCFYFGVSTTGIYCRPSCASRRARAEHICFYDDIAAARAAGLRPCKRCRPDGVSRFDQHAALIARACRRIENAVEVPDLAALAREAHLSRFHFHRLFKQHTGLTPRGYLRAQRAQRMRGALARGESVTGAIFTAGYGSSSRFYEGGAQALGMTASVYRARGAGEQIAFALRDCSLGKVLVAATRRGVCSILLGDDAAVLLQELQRRFSAARLTAGNRRFQRTVAQVVALVEQPGRGLELPLDVRGTAFQHRVWQALRAVPPGQTVSYGEIARRLGRPKAVRAVARAVATNPVAIAIPCHRVIASDGSLSGYRWGVARKRALLTREAAGRDRPEGRDRHDSPRPTVKPR
jgi:AraC family transcriptional regulator, regulatory protein of adaptative response / methylated-DNA-[protein]-cysteine methyltransferase